MAEIVGIVAGVVAPALELGKCFKKQFNYLCRLKTNIKDLQVAAKHLENKRVDLQNKVDAAKRNGELILREVETWLADAEETQRTAQQIIETQIHAGILCLKPRYSLSRKAMKKTEILIKLQDTCNFNPLSTPRTFDPPAPSKGTMIDSRKETEEDIIMAIKDAGVSVIGLWGMGGVGKTTMAERIMARAGEEGLFDEFPFVTVSQQPDMLKIQRGIADWLDLKLDQEALEPRANRLRARLTDAKRKLIVIDDVWESIDLENLGISARVKTGSSFTVLLTSRNKGVLGRMNAEKVYTVDILSDGEAWFMFKENARACVDDSNLLPIAREVAKECKGLPLALVVVGKTLNDEKNIRVWSDALTQLKSGNPIGMPDVIEGVYNPIKLSIDFLDSPQAKSLLFLCSSFPEDHDIRLEELVFYSFGLCMFDDINNLEGARNRIATLISTLKSRSLILDGRNEDDVKMHDVVRDVVIFIASKEKQGIVEISSSNEWSREFPYSDCTMLSVVVAKEKNIELLPMELAATFPNIRFLWMRNQHYKDLHSMSVHFLKGMKQLKVLHIELFSFGSTLQSMEQLKNLHTLHLKHCDDLETLSPVGELSSLEILICHSCMWITELPVEIGRLNRLRLLEIVCCERLETITPDVISRLGRLEELKMIDSFKGWESVEEGSNASLAELETLCNLRVLEIEIEDWILAAQELQLLSSSKIVKYDIRVGKRPWWVWSTTKHEKKLSLKFPKGATLLSIGKWIDVFARSADFLYLEGHGASNTFDFALGCQNKKHLHLNYCPTVEKLGVFPVLETLRLWSLPNLVELCHGSNNSFAKLKDIEIMKCSKLRSLFTSSLEVIRSLSQQLETLEIWGCESMEEVFSIELLQENIVSPITFPKLKYLGLRNLESLTTLCKGNIIHFNIQFPQLLELRIINCPKLMTSGFIIIDSDQNHHLNSSSSSSAHIQDSIHLFCHEKVKFGSLSKLVIGGYENIIYLWCHHIPHPFFGGLEELRISYCANINNLFSYSIAANLGNLRTLEIERCNEMVHVIADDKAETTVPLTIIFHKLEVVKLVELPKLQSFCEGNWELLFPLLKQVNIEDCPGMEGFTMGSIGAPNLKEKSVTFPILESLTLCNLHSLTTLCKGNDDGINIQFPRLESLVIVDCPKLTSFISIDSHQNQLLNSSSFSSSSAHHDSIHMPCHKKVKFGSLKKLGIGGYENIICLWCHHIPHPFFGGLEQLRISKCVNINNLFSYSIAANLGNLRTLEIERCNEMVYAIADDKAETKPLTLIFQKLEEVKLVELPKLQSFCEGRWPDLQFPSLERVVICECPDMKGFSLGSISTPNLKEFTVDCQNKITNLHERKLSLKFPMGKTLLLSLGKWIDVFARSADYLYLEGDASNTFDFALGCYTQNKQHLELIDCGTVEKLGVFPVLKRLYLESLPNLVEIWDGSNNSFSKLKKIYIWKCSKLRCLFTSSVVIRSLSQQLQTLEIEDCESMEEVFSIELLQEGIVSPITFPKLKYLFLSNLESLTTLCKGIIHDDIINNIWFPQLLELIIEDCPKLLTSFINIDYDQNHHLNCASSSSSAHIQDSIHLLCHQTVKFGSLKNLWIGGYENMSYVWCHHIPHPFFGGLQKLHIFKCANINNLFSYSVAANLDNLKRLYIEECNEMVYVIADDNEQTTVPITIIIFHKLEKVRLLELPKLASFCEGGWSELLFPSLKKVEMEKCPDMKGFSLGSISTPNLKEFKVDGQQKSMEDFIKHPWQQVRSLNSESESEIC